MMDSLNLSETQNNSLNSKTTGSNTSPMTCACCGSKYYMQHLPQPCCFRIHHPEMTKCKDPQELFEENIKNPKSGFPPIPFFHPIFHNSLLPLNSCYVHDHLNDPAKNEEKKCENEREGVSNLSRQGRNELRENNNNKAQDDPQKYVSGSESSILGHSYNLMDPHFNPFFQPTSWGDFMPWTYSPFFTPMMSYCLFWNSHKFAANASFKNYRSNSGETECPNNKSIYQAPSNDNNDNKEIEETDIKTCFPEGCLEVEQNNDRSTENIEEEEKTVGCANLNTNSDSIFGDEDREAEMEEFEAVEKEEESVECAITSSDIICREEEDAVFEELENLKVKEFLECAKISPDDISGENDSETTGFDSAVLRESNDHFEVNDTDLQNYKTCFSTELEDNSNEGSQQLGESEISYLMARKISENTEDSSASEIQVNLSDALPVDDNLFPSNQDNQSGKPNLISETENYQERVPFKKTFKNFTIADQTNDTFFNEAQISVAAAGDLGGENCLGYKVTIVPFEKDEERVSPETKPPELQQKDLETKGPKSLQKNALSDPVKNSNEKSKCMRTSKTRIAKLLNNSKPKESKTDTLKISKQNVQSNQKEANVVRCKHNCLFNDNNNNHNNKHNNNNNFSSSNNNNNHNNNKVVSANEKALKSQKTKNCTVAEQQIQGPKKHSKEMNLKNNSSKSEKKLQRLKF